MIEISKRISSWFSIWVFTLFVILVMFRKKFNVRHEKIIICMTLACSILGCFVIRKYYDKIQDKYKLLVNIGDIFCHIIPFIYILSIMKKRYIKNTPEMFILPIILGLFYILFYKPSEVYWITGWSDKELILSMYLLYILILMFY